MVATNSSLIGFKTHLNKRLIIPGAGNPENYSVVVKSWNSEENLKPAFY